MNRHMTEVNEDNGGDRFWLLILESWKLSSTLPRIVPVVIEDKQNTSFITGLQTLILPSIILDEQAGLQSQTGLCLNIDFMTYYLYEQGQTA